MIKKKRKQDKIYRTLDGACDVCKKSFDGEATVYLHIKGMSTHSFQFWEGKNNPKNFIFGEIKCHIGCLPSFKELLAALNVTMELKGQR